MKEFQINDNIKLTYIPMKKLKTTNIGVYIHTPLCEETVSLNALLPLVLKRGNSLCADTEEQAKYLEGLYGASLRAGILKIGDDHVIFLNLETISDKFAPSGEKLSMELTNLMMALLFECRAFTDDILAQEKKNAKEKILAEINEKRIYAQNRCKEEMFRGQSYALSALGTTDGIDKISAKDLLEHYKKTVTSSVIDIFVCGDADADAIEEKIKKAAANYTFAKASLPQQSMFLPSGGVKRVTDHLDVVQGKLSMGFATHISGNDEMYPALMVLNSIFGSGAHSKLFNNVREKLSLCYYASSGLLNNKGVMLVNAGIEFENFQKAHDEILAQLDIVKKGEISDYEFKSSKIFILNHLESLNDDEMAMQSFFIRQQSAGIAYGIEELKEKIMKVTVSDVTEAAKKIELDTVYFLAGKENE